MHYPKYQHDCENCIYLGLHTVESEDEEGHTFYIAYDLYICLNKDDSGFPSLVARYGDEGWEYLSSPALANHFKGE